MTSPRYSEVRVILKKAGSCSIAREGAPGACGRVWLASN